MDARRRQSPNSTEIIERSLSVRPHQIENWSRLLHKRTMATKSEAEDLVSMLCGRLMFSRIEPNQSGSEQWLDDQAARQVKPWTQSLLRIIMVISVMGLANDFTSDHHTIDCKASMVIWSNCACWMVLNVEIGCNYP
eukprot:TRINITY_DN15872_c0_g2_i2.p2 TRINITY_DN15872_c0_g2~~TRINITY_DN15872_c0_g2_i2.p2  ORF type:complete len:137 (-),score=8.97 TRINITY_DN15872_c0_g2_i2:656-1066(-)